MPQSEMSDLHCRVLQTSGQYLLCNITPTESLWASLTSEDILSPDMVQNIEASSTIHEKVAKLLAVLPSKGHEAFETFCDVLMERDHPHVAEYLKTEEVANHILKDVQTVLQSSTQEQVIKSFKRHAPKLQDFAKKKFEKFQEDLNIVEEEKARELAKSRAQMKPLSRELDFLRKFTKECNGIFQNIIEEFEDNFLSKTLLEKVKSILKDLLLPLENKQDADDIKQFCNNFQKLLAHLECFAGGSLYDPSNSDPLRFSDYDPNLSIGDKLNALKNSIASLGIEMENRTQVPGKVMAIGMEKLSQKLSELEAEVKEKLDQTDQMEAQILLLLTNTKETNRLHREMEETHSHVEELVKIRQSVEIKSIIHDPDVLEKLEVPINNKNEQMQELRKLLNQRMKSADERHTTLWNLLPDRPLDQLSQIPTAETEAAERLCDSYMEVTRSTASVDTNMPARTEGADVASTAEMPKLDHETPVSKKKRSKIERGPVKDVHSTVECQSFTLEIKNSNPPSLELLEPSFQTGELEYAQNQRNVEGLENGMLLVQSTKVIGGNVDFEESSCTSLSNPTALVSGHSAPRRKLTKRAGTKSGIQRGTLHLAAKSQTTKRDTLALNTRLGEGNSCGSLTPKQMKVSSTLMNTKKSNTSRVKWTAKHNKQDKKVPQTGKCEARGVLKTNRVQLP